MSTLGVVNALVRATVCIKLTHPANHSNAPHETLGSLSAHHDHLVNYESSKQYSCNSVAATQRVPTTVVSRPAGTHNVQPGQGTGPYFFHKQPTRYEIEHITPSRMEHTKRGSKLLVWEEKLVFPFQEFQAELGQFMKATIA